MYQNVVEVGDRSDLKTVSLILDLITDAQLHFDYSSSLCFIP